MKRWRIDYSTRYVDGEEKHDYMFVEAGNITIALGTALAKIMPEAKTDPRISERAVYNVGICANSKIFEVAL
ncbi:MAG: hypothetical protein J6S50_00475 [Oscillospiraceae bacterium]|nr:hypothetical protein [Oscillospiraceae bacterium]MBO7726976.1 hypothetical protein [Oscillospiraceae bacterium]